VQEVLLPFSSSKRHTDDHRSCLRPLGVHHLPETSHRLSIFGQDRTGLPRPDHSGYRALAPGRPCTRESSRDVRILRETPAENAVCFSSIEMRVKLERGLRCTEACVRAASSESVQDQHRPPAGCGALAPFMRAGRNKDENRDIWLPCSANVVTARARPVSRAGVSNIAVAPACTAPRLHHTMLGSRAGVSAHTSRRKRHPAATVFRLLLKYGAVSRLRGSWCIAIMARRYPHGSPFLGANLLNIAAQLAYPFAAIVLLRCINQLGYGASSQL